MIKKIIILMLIIIMLLIFLYLVFSPSPEVRDCMRFGELDRSICEQFFSSE